MLTKRSLLQGFGAATVLPIIPARSHPSANIRIDPVSLKLAPESEATPALHLTGPDLGDALRLDCGRTTLLRYQNAAAEPVALQWRGLRRNGSLRSVSDAIAPGSDGTLQVTPCDSGTALLRASPTPTHPASRGAQVVVVVPEAIPVPVDHDLVVAMADWLVAADNSLRFGSVPPVDAVRGAITVNGQAGPLDVKVAPRARLRLRFVNTSVQRLMIVTCAGAQPKIAAIDGQPSELFAPVRNTVPIGPGARYDLLLDMPETAGRCVRFSLKPTRTIASGLEPERDLLVLTARGDPLPAKPALTPLPVNPLLPISIPLEAARRVDLTLSGQPATPKAPPMGWSVNAIPGSAAGRPVLTVRQGDAVVLGFVNASSTLVPVRIGGHAVRLLHAKDDGWEPYWRDTVLLPPGTRNHVAFVADTEGQWPIDSGFDDLTLAGLSCLFSVEPR